MPQFYLAVAAIVKNEAAYIEEWVAFHQLVGVQHFWLYDNSSSDGTRDIINRMDSELVTLVKWPGKNQQLDAYQDALHHVDARWCAFIDVDEFLHSPRLLPLPSVLGYYESHPYVGANWAVFGTSGFDRPQRRVIGTYYQRALREHPMNRHVKSIVQVDAVAKARPGDPHHFGPGGVDEYGRSLDGPHSRQVSWSFLRVNHYWSKSREDALRKSRLPRADTSELRPLTQMLNTDFNAVDDNDTHAFAPLIERRIELL